MNLNESLLQSSWMKALGWTFVHSIWQIALIGLALFIILRCIPGRSAHTRYTFATLGLWTTLVTALCTFIIMLPEKQTLTELSGRIIFVSSTKPVTLTSQLSYWLEARMPMMLSIWFGGVAILMLRLGISLGWVSHLRYDSFPEEQLQYALDQITQRLKLKVKPVTSESAHIKSPLTIGHLKPVILFPIGIINQLSANDVEAILTHELAHIVRKDYLSNLIQSFIETLFYYHPVTWWMSRVVRTERENRADDLAVSWCGDHLGYAKALITIEEMQTQTVPNLTLGFASGKGAMLARIQRILNLPYKNHNQMEKTVLLCLCSICFLAFTLSSQAHENERTANLTPAAIQATFAPAVPDSIPTSGTYKIHKKTDKEDISIEVENGDIKQLKIDGKEIAPSEFDQYDDVIDEMFGSIEAPPSMEGFAMPTLPSLPALPSMPALPSLEGRTFIMPAMPPLPPMEPMELEKLLHENQARIYANGQPYKIEFGDNFNYDFNFDSLGNGGQMYIYNGMDSILIAPWPGEGNSTIALNLREMNNEDWQKWAEKWQEDSEKWGKEWQEQAEQWKEQSKKWQEQQGQWREDQKRFRDEQSRYRDEEKRYRELYQGDQRSFFDEDQAREEAEHALQGELFRVHPGEGISIYGVPSPRISISDALIEDGLIKPGEEAQIQLTPDKLKINGHKMSDELHDKYLELYEQQQGVELSGNSRVEFTTKTRQRM